MSNEASNECPVCFFPIAEHEGGVPCCDLQRIKNFQANASKQLAEGHRLHEYTINDAITVHIPDLLEKLATSRAENGQLRETIEVMARYGNLISRKGFKAIEVGAEDE